MILGNLQEALENEKTFAETINENQTKMNFMAMGSVRKPSKWSMVLTSLAHYGMNYEDKVYGNMFAVPMDKELMNDYDRNMQNMLLGSAYNPWKTKPEEYKAFREKTLEQKREMLRKMAMQPELEDIIDIVANEAIVYDDDETYIAQPYVDSSLTQDMTEQYSEKLKECIESNYYKIYMLLDWKTRAWDAFKRFLIDGVLAYEIVYDSIEHPKNIIGIIDIDPATLTKKFIDGTAYWVQYDGTAGQERRMLDSQIIYIKYEDSSVTERQSYLERLIRPFNLYRIVEQAQVIWTVTQSSFKTMFTIPVAGMNRTKGEQTLNEQMSRYREDISFNTESGELLVNGKVNMPFNKEYWMPENDNGKPEVQTLTDPGPSLNDSDQIKYFESKLYRMSKVPASRFDKEASSTWFGSDPTQQLRDEITFTRFVNRMRNTFSEIPLKPLRIQVAIQLPDLKNDKRVLNAISLRFNSYNLFEEMMNIEIMTKRIEFVGTFKDTLSVQDADGNEIPYFSPKFLIEKYLKMSQSDLELNDKYRMEDEEARRKAVTSQDAGTDGGNNMLGGGEPENPDLGGGNEDNGGQPENGQEGQPQPEQEENPEPDNEMMGDVQPENGQ